MRFATSVFDEFRQTWRPYLWGVVIAVSLVLVVAGVGGLLETDRSVQPVVPDAPDVDGQLVSYRRMFDAMSRLVLVEIALAVALGVVGFLFGARGKVRSILRMLLRK